MSLHEGLKSRGALIVVEGLDRAGKTSQCQLLLEDLRKRGHQAKYIKFPGTPSLLPTDLLTETCSRRQEYVYWQDDQ